MGYLEITFEITDLDYEESEYSSLEVGDTLSPQLEVLNAVVLEVPVEKRALDSGIEGCEFAGRIDEIVSRGDFGKTAIQQLLIDAGVPIRVTNYPQKLINYKKTWVKCKGHLYGLIGLDYPRFLSQRVEGKITHIQKLKKDKINELKKVEEYPTGCRLFVTIKVTGMLSFKKSKWAAGY